MPPLRAIARRGEAVIDLKRICHAFSITGMADTTVRASCWSVTINNPTEDDRKRLGEPPDWVKEVHYQDEVGQEGTLHIQGCLVTAQCRFSKIKSYLPRAHIEVARSKEALLKYVKKTDTAVEGTQKIVEGSYVTMHKALMMIAEKHRDDFGIWFMESDRSDRDVEEWKRKEFWQIVNEILVDRPEIVSILTDARLERAWLKTRGVWITLLDRQDRQTELEDEDIPVVRKKPRINL